MLGSPFTDAGRHTDSLKAAFRAMWRNSCDKAHTELGFDPGVDFTDGLRATIAWYLANEPWWKTIMDDGRYRGCIAAQYSN